MWITVLIIIAVLIVWAVVALRKADNTAKNQARAKILYEAGNAVCKISNCPKCRENIALKLFACLSEQCKSNNSPRCKCKCSFNFQPDLKEIHVVNIELVRNCYYSRTDLPNMLYVPEHDLMLSVEFFGGGFGVFGGGIGVCLKLPASRNAEQLPFLSMPLGQYLQEYARPSNEKESLANHNNNYPSRIGDEFELAAMESKPEQLVTSTASQPADDSAKQNKPIGGYW